MNHAVAVAAADAVPGGQDVPKIKVKQTTMKGPEWRLDVVQFMALMISAVFGLGQRSMQTNETQRRPSALSTKIPFISVRKCSRSFPSKYSYLRT